MATRMLSDDAGCQQLLSLATRSETFIVSKGHRRTRSDYGAQAVARAVGLTAAVESTSGHKRLSKRLSLETRPTASTSQRPRIAIEPSQRRIADDVNNRIVLERARRGVRNAEDEEEDSSSGSSSDENVRPERQRRPQSAWNSRSGPVRVEQPVRSSTSVHLHRHGRNWRQRR